MTQYSTTSAASSVHQVRLMLMVRIVMTVVTGAAGADLYHDPGSGLSRLRVSEDRGRVTARDNQQELRMRRVPGSGQVRSHEDRVPCIKCSSTQERVTEGQHQRCQNSCHHSHCLLCLLVSVLPHLHSIICGKGESLCRREATKTSLVQSWTGQEPLPCHALQLYACGPEDAVVWLCQN